MYGAHYLSVIELAYTTILGIFLLISLLYYVITAASLSIQRKYYPSSRKKPFVSVHVPVYNDIIVGRLLDALKRQKYEHFEVIVVDDSDDPETRRVIDVYEKDPRIKVIRRDRREGYKAGALNEALKHSKGEIIVVFDSDFVPRDNFLEEVVKPFEDPSISYVQARWDFENLDENLVTVFAGVPLLMYHYLFYPLMDRFGVPYLSGTAMAIRKKALEDVGGWRNGTLTEDGDMSMRLIMKGYRGAYLHSPETPSQLPRGLKTFCVQQQRWSTGMLEALYLNGKALIYSKKINFTQKMLALVIPLLNLIFPVVAIIVVVSLYLWGVGVSPITPEMAPILLLLGSGYVVAGLVSLYKKGKLHLFPHFILSTYIVGPVLAFYNTLAMVKRAITGHLHWVVTPKEVRAANPTYR